MGLVHSCSVLHARHLMTDARCTVGSTEQEAQALVTYKGMIRDWPWSRLVWGEFFAQTDSPAGYAKVHVSFQMMKNRVGGIAKEHAAALSL